MTLSFEDITYLLLYFPVDSTFMISDIRECEWSQKCFTAIQEDVNGKHRLIAEYDGKPYSAIIIQCASRRENLSATLNYVCELKAVKKFPVEKILPEVPRFVSDKRSRFRPVKVMMGFTSMLVNLSLIFSSCQLIIDYFY
jgi:hypothetical protein